MKHPLFIAVVATVLSAASAATAELPSYELTGFPITSHQVATLGSAQIQERSAVPELTFNGMPASPHQVAVLTPRHRIAATPHTERTTVSLSTQ